MMVWLSVIGVFGLAYVVSAVRFIMRPWRRDRSVSPWISWPLVIGCIGFYGSAFIFFALKMMAII